MIMSIDIGTSYSSSCISGPDGLARPVEIGTGASMFGSRFSLPSAVFVEENGDILVGQAAMNSRKRKPENFRMEFKRNFGETYPILLGNRSFLPEELYTELLRHIKACAEKASGEKVELAYLTHPATYGKARVEKLCIAARAAGLFDVETVDEPTAAAMNYCAAGYIQDGQTLLVYDFGGGTFDVSLIRYENGEFSPLSESEGLEQCGGIDIDRLIYQDMLSTVGSGLLAQLQTNPLHYKRFAGQLSELAVKAKHHLSAAKIFEEPIEIGFEMIPYRLTLDRFNQMVAPLVGQTITTCHLILKNAGLTCSDLSAILMVGGTSRVPLVQEMVRQFAGQIPVHCADDLELAVAQGAINYRQFRAKADEPTPEQIKQWCLEGARLDEEGKPEEAIPWFRKAAEHGVAVAQYALGNYYETGQGIQQNLEMAAYWYYQAAEQGYADAQFALGVCYEGGRGTKQDLEQAVRWYHYAAEQGIAEAQYNLGGCYIRGRGTKQNLEGAVHWFRKAAEQGLADAQYNYGICCEKGYGTAKNPAEAKEWFRKAADQGCQEAGDALDRLAKEWVDTHVPADSKAFVASTVQKAVSSHPALETMWTELFSNKSKMETLYQKTRAPHWEKALFGFSAFTGGFLLTENGVYSKNLWEHHTFTWKEFLDFKVKIDLNDSNSQEVICVSIDRGSGGNACVAAGSNRVTQSLGSFWQLLQKTLRENRDLI